MIFYATIAYDQLRKNTLHHMPLDQAYLLPATSWANHQFKKPLLPDGLREVAADSGGFVASRIWGEYRFSMAQYVQWLLTFNPSWAATMDYCCEPPLTKGDKAETRRRQDKTTVNAYKHWEHYSDLPWLWMPTIQGWQVADYERHAEEMKPLIMEMKSFYANRGGGSNFRVGLGTLCARKDTTTAPRVLKAVSAILPGVQFHLFGVKLQIIQRHHLPNVISTDSAVWHGRFSGENREAQAYCAEMEMQQREYIFKKGLPTYLSKIEKAIQQPKRTMMF